MSLSPIKIYQNLKEKKLDRKSAADLLIILIENSEDDDIRFESAKYLEKIGLKNNKIFEVLENLLISDSNGKVRNTAATCIKNIFIDRAISPMKWAIQNESDYDCIITIVKTLVNVDNNEAKSILIDELKKIKKKKIYRQGKAIS